MDLIEKLQLKSIIRAKLKLMNVLILYITITDTKQRVNLKNSIGNVLTPFNKRIGFAFTETNKKIYSGHRNYVAKKYDDDPLETN